MKAPDFSLPDQNGTIHSLSDHVGKWLVLYFYPTDDTPTCTKEACSFRDSINEFKKRGIEVLGISNNDIKSHERFSKKHSLNFPILSDHNHEVIEKYGSWAPRKLFGHEFIGTNRDTYLINPNGEIVKNIMFCALTSTSLKLFKILSFSKTTTDIK